MYGLICDICGTIIENDSDKKANTIIFYNTPQYSELGSDMVYCEHNDLQFLIKPGIKKGNTPAKLHICKDCYNDIKNKIKELREIFENAGEV